MVFESNLNVLGQRHGDIYTKITAEDFSWDTSGAAVELAKNGEQIVKLRREDNWVALNSSYNPSAEAKRFMAEYLTMPEGTMLAMFGLANGAFVREFIEQSSKNVTILIYEPSIDVFMQVMQNIDITDILEDKRVWLVVEGINTYRFNLLLQWCISCQNLDLNQHVLLPVYQQYFEESCHSVIKMMKDKYAQLQIDMNTLKVFGSRICYTNLNNLRFLEGCRSGVDYKNLFPQDMPAIVVSAGPSLEKNMMLLKEAKGKALILAVDSALPVIMGKGIIPDMVISVDMQKPLRLFQVDGLKDIPFLADAAMNTDVLEYLQPSNLIFYSSDTMLWEDLFEAEQSELEHVYAGGSVALDAMVCLLNWGFKTIIMIGQDLTFTGNKIHAGEAERDWSKHDRKLFKIKDIHGEEVYTQADYYSFIKCIETFAYTHPDTKFIDATEGGAYKENTEIMTFRDAIDQYCVKEYDVAKYTHAPRRLFVDDAYEKVSERLCKMKENLLALEKELRKGYENCTTACNMLKKGNYDVKKLKRINKELEELDEYYEKQVDSVYLIKYSAEFMYGMQKNLYAENDDAIQDAIQLYERKGDFYKGLAGSTDPMVKLIDECVDKMKR